MGISAIKKKPGKRREKPVAVVRKKACKRLFLAQLFSEKAAASHSPGANAKGGRTARGPSYRSRITGRLSWRARSRLSSTASSKRLPWTHTIFDCAALVLGNMKKSWQHDSSCCQACAHRRIVESVYIVLCDFCCWRTCILGTFWIEHAFALYNSEPRDRLLEIHQWFWFCSAYFFQVWDN